MYKQDKNKLFRSYPSHEENVRHINFWSSWLNFQDHNGTYCVKILHFTPNGYDISKGIWWMAFKLGPSSETWTYHLLVILGHSRILCVKILHFTHFVHNISKSISPMAYKYRYKCIWWISNVSTFGDLHECEQVVGGDICLCFKKTAIFLTNFNMLEHIGAVNIHRCDLVAIITFQPCNNLFLISPKCRYCANTFVLLS